MFISSIVFVIDKKMRKINQIIVTLSELLTPENIFITARGRANLQLLYDSHVWTRYLQYFLQKHL